MKKNEWWYVQCFWMLNGTVFSATDNNRKLTKASNNNKKKKKMKQDKAIQCYSGSLGVCVCF